MNLPNVDFYKDWISWAKALTTSLKTPPLVMPLILPQYTTANLPPANRDGMVAWDLTQERMVYSRAGNWYLISSDVLVI